MAEAAEKVRARARARDAANADDPLAAYDVARIDAHAEAAALPPPRVAQPTNATWWDENFDWEGGGAFEECVGIAEGNVDDPEAFCAQRHYDATGSWPAEKGTVAAVALPDGKLASAFIPDRKEPS